MNDAWLSALCSVCGSEYGDHKNKNLRCPFPEKGRKRNEFAIDIRVNGEKRSTSKPFLSFDDLVGLLVWKGSKIDKEDVTAIWLRSETFVGAIGPGSPPVRVLEGMTIDVEIGSQKPRESRVIVKGDQLSRDLPI